MKPKYTVVTLGKDIPVQNYCGKCVAFHLENCDGLCTKMFHTLVFRKPMPKRKRQIRILNRR